MKADLVLERVAARLRRWSLQLYSMIATLLGARVSKHALGRPELDYKLLPLDEEVTKWIGQQKFCGRQIVLVADVPSEVCASIAKRLNLSSDLHPPVPASSLANGLPPLLRQEFPDGFVYAGRNATDLDIWRASRAAVLCRTPRHLAASVRDLGKPILAEFPPARIDPAACVRALRPHHWVKNLLIFAPPLLGNALSEPSVLLNCTIGFLLLGIVASCTYLLNDVLDLEADRQHRSKAARPFAAGEVPLLAGFVIAPIGIALGLLAAWCLSLQFAVVLIGYVLLSLSYSIILKRFALVDAFSIATLYVLRLAIGTVLSDVPFSPWLLAFAMFFFFSLVLAKRQTEIEGALAASSTALRERGYRPSDAPVTLALGVATGTASVIILIIYLTQEVFGQTLYLHPTRLWAVPVGLALWMNHIWLRAHRGELYDDPVHFALRDPASLMLGLGMLVAFVLAIL
jgi:4-hydroxybenzoate polyprenyltransferase